MAQDPGRGEDLELSLECARNLLALKSTPENGAQDRDSLRQSAHSNSTPAGAGLRTPKEDDDISEKNSESDANAPKVNNRTGPRAGSAPDQSNNVHLECEELRRRNAAQGREISQLQAQVRDLTQYIRQINGDRSHLESIVRQLQRRVAFLEGEHGLLHDSAAVRRPDRRPPRRRG